MKTTRIILGLILAITAATPLHAQVSAFTYQARLNLNGTPASGYYDFMFRLLNDPTNGTAAPVIPINLAVPVTNGLFTTGMDFGAENFNGANRWLEINVRTNSGGPFTTLSPRQLLTPTPYAIHSANASSAASVSGSVSAAQLTGTISSNNIGVGSITSPMLAAGAVGSNQLASGAVTADKMVKVTVPLTPVIFTNPTPSTSDYFGVALTAVGSDRVLIGAFRDDTGAEDTGAAYLFNINGTLLTTFTNPTPSVLDGFGFSAVAVGSDLVLIGAGAGGTGADHAGAAYLFRTNGTLLMTFTNPTPAAFEGFGSSMAVVGKDRVLIGANSDSTHVYKAGAAYLFSTNGTLLTTFTNPTPAADDYFGVVVAALGGDRVLIGAHGDDTGATDSGAAYLFSTNGVLLTTFTNPAPALRDYFGFPVAAMGTDRVLIGAIGNDAGAIEAGAAYLFNTNGELLTTFTKPTPAASDEFGYSITSVGTDRILIGARYDDKGAFNAGAAYLFSTDGAVLATFTNPAPANSDWFGSFVAVVGSDRVLIGAYGDDTGGTDAGAAYLFSFETYTPGLVADGVNARSITTASLEDGAVTAAKIGGVLLPSQIPYLDASKVTSGTLADASLSSNVARLNANQVFTGSNRFAGVVELTNAANSLAGTFSGNGLGLTNLNAAQITGTISPNNIAAGVISGAMLAAGAVGSNQLADGATLSEIVDDDGAGSGLDADLLDGLDSAAIFILSENEIIAGRPAFNGGASGSTPPFTVDSTNAVANLNADLLDGLDATGFWKLAGNSGVTPGTHFLGTTDNQPLEFRVNKLRAFRLEHNGNGAPNVIGGSPYNFVAAGVVGTVIGGGGATNNYGMASSNSVLSDFGVVGGGLGNRIAPNSFSVTIAGGMENTVGTNSDFSTIGGGSKNNIAANSGYAIIAGGYENNIGTTSWYNAIGGGYENNIADYCGLATVAGGFANNIGIYSDYSAIGGGGYNNIADNSWYDTIAGGYFNDIGTNSWYNAIGGGYENGIAVNTQYATIPGGRENDATNYAFAAGYHAKALHTGAFVWSDSGGTLTASLANNSVTMRARGGYRFLTGAGASGAQLEAGATSWAVLSDHNAKKDFAPADSLAILEKLAALPITQWRYRWEEESATPHLGPMAQDFKAAFYPGRDNKSITTLEADGVALAAIQGLNLKLEETRAENAELRKRLAELERVVKRLDGLK